MERRIIEAKEQYQALTRECKTTVDLLNNVIQTCTRQINSLDQLNSNEHRINLKYFLGVSQYQHATHQKILELNVDLEEFLLDNPVSDLQQLRETSRSSSRNYRNSESSLHTPNLPFTACEFDLPKPANLLKLSGTSELNTHSGSEVYSNIVNDETEVETFLTHDHSKLIPVETSSVLNESTSTNTTELYFDLEDEGEYKEHVEDVSKEHVENASDFKLESQEIAHDDKLLDTVSDVSLLENDGPTLSEALSPNNDSPIPCINKSLRPEELQRKNGTFPSNINKILVSEGVQLKNHQTCMHSFKTIKPDEHEVECNQTSETNLKLELSQPKIVPKSPPLENSQFCTSISEALKKLSVLSSEQKFAKTTSNSPMPDILLKPSDVKHFVVADDISDSSDTNEENSSNNVKEDPVLEENKVRKRVGWKENTNVSDTNVPENAVFDVDFRSTPLVGDVCMIGFVESPSDFYIQVSDENSVLIDVISQQLSEINDNTTLLCSTKLEAINQLGKFCTLAIDGVWYRGEVVDWLQNSNSDQVYVQLIDFGNQYSVSFKVLRPLPPFCRSHRLAQKCYLAYLYPPGSTRKFKLKEWPTACKEAFLNYCGDIDQSDFRISYIHPSPSEKNAYEIDLIRMSENYDDKSIGELLLEAQLAVQIIDDLNGLVNHEVMFNQILEAHGIGGIRTDMTQDEIFDVYFQKIDEEPNNINEAVMNYNPRDEAETCRNLRPDGTCYKGSSCKWRHEVLKTGYTYDKQAVYWKAFSELCLPAAGEDISLTISHVVDLQCFYAQIRDENDVITCSINDLTTAMNEPQTIKIYKKFEQIPYASEIVIAKHWNNYWYRGQVRYVTDSDCKIAEAEVFFVDFGDMLTIPISDLRNILPEFLKLPFQAVECRFYNLKHKEGSNEKIEKTYFESKLLGVTLDAHIVAVPGHLEVLLRDGSGHDIAEQFIENGFGELNTEHNFPAENELILID